MLTCPKERKVAEPKNDLNVIKNDALLQRCLLNNLDKVLAYFKQFVSRVSPQEIQKRISELTPQVNELQQKMKDTEQKYHEFVFDKDSDDINALRGDNGLVRYYKETYDHLLHDLQPLQQQLDAQNKLLAQIQNFELLKQLLDIKVKVDETQETISWQNSAAYASINRYDNEKDSDSSINYESMLRDYRAKLNDLCAEILKDKEIRAYLNILIAEENKRKIQSKQNPRNRMH